MQCILWSHILWTFMVNFGMICGYLGKINWQKLVYSQWTVPMIFKKRCTPMRQGTMNHGAPPRQGTGKTWFPGASGYHESWYPEVSGYYNSWYPDASRYTVFFYLNHRNRPLTVYR